MQKVRIVETRKYLNNKHEAISDLKSHPRDIYYILYIVCTILKNSQPVRPQHLRNSRHVVNNRVATSK